MMEDWLDMCAKQRPDEKGHSCSMDAWRGDKVQKSKKGEEAPKKCSKKPRMGQAGQTQPTYWRV